MDAQNHGTVFDLVTICTVRDVPVICGNSTATGEHLSGRAGSRLMRLR